MPEPKRMGTLNPDGMRRGKAAMIAPATNRDQARTAGAWQLAHDIAPGQPVEAVNHLGQFVFEVGDEVIVQDVGGATVARALLRGIRMVDGAGLTDAEIRALGYETRAGYLAEWGRFIKSHAWFYEIERLS